jgi:hypothetical protein
MANDDSNQLNLTVVALVALVAIVGLVALVMNAATIAKLPVGSKIVAAQEAEPMNIAGNGICTVIKPMECVGRAIKTVS